MRCDSFRGLALAALIFSYPWIAHADEPEGSTLLASILNDSSQDKKETRRVPEPSGASLPHDRLAVGLNYTGGQVRWNSSPRWATEARVQLGSADSNYGKVHSTVFGLREYRFIPFRQHLLWYAGAEGAYARADADNTMYETKGIAIGAFGGLEYRVFSRISVAGHIGPYVISLKEKQTGLSNTGLDFVVNTALIFHLF